MRTLRIALLAGSLSLLGGCENFLDVNTNPNAPQTVAANLYLPSMIHWMVMTPHWDGRFTSAYTQQLTQTTVTNWDRMGYVPSSDAGGEHWRTVYWIFGQNLIDMMTIAERERRWDLLGVGYVLKAWGWQQGAILHGEMIISEAFNQTRFEFPFDSEEFVYQETLRMLDSAIVNLERTDGAVSAAFLARGDRMYSGDRARWLRFAHGLRAMTLNAFSNHPSYNPSEVIAAVDRSFASGADDAVFVFPNNVNDDRNFLARSRGNYVNHRQTQFVVDLMNGTAFGAPDPRMTRMLVPAPDGQYRGMNVNQAETAIPVNQRPFNPHGYAGAGGLQQPGMYVFDDAARVPVMTYAQLQFIKAEAAHRMGNRAIALQAYRNGINAHIDFVNSNVRENDRNTFPWWPSAITTAQRNAFLADPRVVPTNASDLTLTHIMTQKYIAQWGWAFNETWMDMKRFGYVGVDPQTGNQVYPGFLPPTNLFPDNAGKLVYRLRPRFNSEYVWNRPALDAIGALELDWHTKPLWVLAQ
jgi:hypothetical protein